MDLEQLQNDPAQIQQLIALLQSLLPSDTEETKPIVKKEPPKSAVKNKKGKVSQDKNTTNKFLTMGVKHLHKEDSAIDKILAKSPRCDRTRKFSKVDVVCRACGKRESISPALLFDSANRYKCNKCSSSAG